MHNLTTAASGVTFQASESGNKVSIYILLDLHDDKYYVPMLSPGEI